MTKGNETGGILDLRPDRIDGTLQRDILKQLSVFLKEAARASDEDRSRKSQRIPESLRVDPNHKHRAILLAGRRGEGKTTLLTHILRLHEDPQLGGSNRADYEKTTGLLSLGLIDPTMLESKQNIIMSVISRINDIVDHNHRLGDRSGTVGDHSYRDVKEAFAELAAGVTVLDGVGHDLHQGENWADARFIMEHGLERTEAAYGFNGRLKRYIEKAARYLCCPGFLLCIDDVDTRFDIGEKVLEALRKYLTSPYLHIIVSGDPELMLTLVRRLQWQEMGKEYLKFEQDVHPRDARASQLDSALEHMGSLTDQYLTKVLPIERRLRLKTLGELDKTQGGKDGLKVRFSSEEPKPLRDVVDGIINSVWGIRHRDDMSDLRDLLLRLPIRSIIEVLRASDGPKADSVGTDEETNRVLNALLQISQTDLRNADAPPIEALRSAPPALTYALIARWFSQHQMWRSHGALAIRFADDTENRVAFSISAVLAQRCRGDLGAILSFWLSFALLHDRAERLDSEHGQASSSDPSTDFKLFQFLGMGRLERAIVQMERLAAWERGVSDTRRVLGGLRLSGLAVPAIRMRSYNEAFHRLFGSEWTYKNPTGAKPKPGSKTTAKELVFFDGQGRNPELDKIIDTFPEEIQAYHKLLKKAQDEGYRYGGTRQYLKRAVCNTIEDLTEGLAGAASVAVRLPYSFVISGQGAAFGNYGFPRLLAVMIEVLDAARDAASAKDAERFVRAVIEQAILPRGHATRFAGDIGIEDSGKAIEAGLEAGDAPESQEDESETDTASPPEDTGFGKLVQALAAWAVTTRQTLTDGMIAPQVLLSIWKRFSFAQGRLFDDPVHDGQNRRYLGYMMHRSVVIFLHAVAVEAMRGEDLSLTASLLNNPTKSDKLFASLLDTIGPGKNTAFADTAGGKMFDALFSCPLWGFFLKSEATVSGREAEWTAKVRKAYIKRLSETTSAPEALFKSEFTPAGRDVEPVAFEGLYDLLNSVYLQA